MQKLAVGKILQGLRKAKGITQEQLSEILGVSCAAISKWENEQMYPDISFFPILARYFNVSIDCLFGFSNELTEKEYNDFKEECTELFAQKQYFNGMEKIKALCYLFPTNDRLKLDLIIAVIPYIALAQEVEIREKVVYQMIALCQNCASENVQAQKHFVLGHLFMLIGQYKHFPFSFSDSEVKNFAAVDMTNSLLLRTDEKAINKIETAIISLGVQLLHELRNKISYLQKENDLQGALAVTKNQITLAGLLELDHSVYFMLYMNVSHLYCLLKEKENAEQAVEKFVKLLREKSIDDSVLLQVYKTGFSAKPFDLIRDTLIFAQLITMLNKEVTT